MTDENPGILSHVSIGTNNFARAVAFYDKVLPTLGCKRILEHPCGCLWQTVSGVLGPNADQRQAGFSQ